MEDALLTTSEAAIKLGVSAERVRQFIKAGRLPSRHIGRDHVIKESDLRLVVERRTGRPPKKLASTNGEPSTATTAPDDGAPGAAIGEEKSVKKARKKRTN